jgi:hypothetical protein
MVTSITVGMEVNTKRIFWSEESARIDGYSPGRESTPDLILQRVHSEDQRAAQRGSDFDFEHR